MWIFLGFFWGVNEGLWFFIIPDIILSYMALKGFKTALLGTLAVIIGAMCAAVGLYAIFSHVPGSIDTMQEIWSALPGYYPKMFEVARGHLVSGGAKGLVSGPQSGIPYRFYILEAYKLNLPLVELLGWTPMARVIRIILAPIVVLILNFLGKKYLSKFVEQKKINVLLMLLIALYWMGIYFWYWGIFLPKTYGG